ncbi:NAD-dependent epimerase/dehydratase family protein [Aurantiacibacter rhizosphaerae]|uniref:NAD(P)H-binding protein n=1 Tax=Aurantiacibacter rhizosphaerae TaxID=2691582 RepID=A0A844XBP3_9SPHN|nr:NAD-dependent epimerase/dehydratase family protein [Aurantiacibacter rhizosphaerae]MWV27406.1 NAD(P)H-binding protein [Aurantiacibacter rhizosphaerae]
MTLAVTGGTGFVGQAVLDAASRQRIDVSALTRRPQESRTHVAWVRGDLSTQDALVEMASGARAIIHIAGVVNAPDSAGFHSGNVAGTEAVTAAARDAGVKRFIHVSSLAAREPGLSDYGHSKRLAEEVVQTSGLDWTIVRPPAVYGPRDTEILELFKAARWGIVPMPPAGRASMIHVDDLARLLLTLVDAGSDSHARVFEPDDGRDGGWTHAELAKAIGQAMGKRVWSPNVPRSVLLGAARLDRLFRRKSAKLTPDRARYMAHPDWISAVERRVPAGMWQAEIETRDGLAETARWYAQHGWL